MAKNMEKLWSDRSMDMGNLDVLCYLHLATRPTLWPVWEAPPLSQVLVRHSQIHASAVDHFPVLYAAIAFCEDLSQLIGRGLHPAAGARASTLLICAPRHHHLSPWMKEV